MVMVLWGVLIWWYTDGWKDCFKRVGERLDATLDFFSFDLLLSTLFAPFRQISAGRVRGPLGVQMQAFFDRLISRCIGAVLRIVMIVIGGVTVLFNLLFGLVLLAAWVFVPLLPIVGAVLFMTGWLPWIK